MTISHTCLTSLALIGHGTRFDAFGCDWRQGRSLRASSMVSSVLSDAADRRCSYNETMQPPASEPTIMDQTGEGEVNHATQKKYSTPKKYYLGIAFTFVSSTDEEENYTKPFTAVGPVSCGGKTERGHSTEY